MQLLVEAREHIDRYEFSQAIEKCKIVLDSADINSEAFELILEILKSNDQLEYKKYLEKYLNFLKTANNFEKYYLFFKEIKSTVTSVSITLRLDFLRSIWELGRLKEFHTECENLHAFCIDQKYFNRLEEVINFLESYSKRKVYLLRGKIILFCEINDEDRLGAVIKEYFEDEVYSKSDWSSVDVDELGAIHQILKLYKEQSVTNAREFIRFEIVNQMLGRAKQKIELRSILEFLLMAKHPEDFYLIFERENHLIVEDAIGVYVKFSFKQKLNKIPFLFVKTRALFASGLTMAKVEHQSDNNPSTAIEAPELYELSNRYDELLPAFMERTHLTSKLERELVTQLKYEEYSQETLNELVISFIEMELYKTALELCKKLDMTSNRFYLSAQINLNSGNYSDVILLVNDVFTKFSLTSVEKTPFNYLKAMAYQKLNNTNEAHELFKLIAITDPGFMDVKGKLVR